MANWFFNLMNKAVDINRLRTTTVLVWGITVSYAFLLIMPSMVGGIVDVLGFTDAQAGYVASAQMFGMMSGALLASFLIQRINLRKGILAGVLTMIIIECLSIAVTSPGMLTAIRFVNGLGAGTAAGMLMAAISGTRNPDRVFALTLVGQYSFAAVGFFGMAYVFQIFGIQGAYVIIGAMALSVVLTVGWFPHTIQAPETSGVKSSSLFTFPVILTLSSLLIFYVANNGIWAYLDRIGFAAGIPIEIVGAGLGVSMLVGIGAGFLSYWIDLKLGRALPIASGVIAMTLGAWMLLGDFTPVTYFAAAAVFNGSLIFVVTYFLGFCAVLDPLGRVVVLANFVIAAGLALGPAAAATLVNEDGYDLVLKVSTAGFGLCLLLIAAAIRIHNMKRD